MKKKLTTVAFKGTPEMETKLDALIAEYNKKHKAKNILAIAVLVLCLIMSSSLGSCGSSSSRKSSSSQPWRELGVSKSEYMEIYNKYKYGG